MNTTITDTNTITNITATSAYLATIADEGARFAAAAEAGDLDAPVPAVADWNVRDLVRHLGLVHLWAAANVRFPSDRWLSVDGLADLAPYWPEHTAGWPPDAELVDWYRSTLSNLAEVFGDTPADHECLTFLPAPSPMVMWARRQASEIGVHRYDIESARGIESHFEPAFASDMLDELLTGFTPHMRGVAPDGDRVLHVAAEDVGTDYWLTLGPGRVRVERSGDRSDLRVSGSAAALNLLLWNRPVATGVEVVGDPGVLDLWRERCQVRWL